MHKIGGDHYPICLNFKFSKIFIIWVGDDKDTVLLNNAGKVVAYRSINELKAFALSESIDLKDDLAIYDSYVIQQWLAAPHPQIDSELFLNHWNLFTDVGESLGVQFIGDVKNNIRNCLYNKLFNGSGIFLSVDPNAVYNDDEVQELCLIMRSGMEFLLDNIVISK